jgi:hypothetical protein
MPKTEKNSKITAKTHYEQKHMKHDIWTELTWAGHEQNSHEPYMNRTCMSRTWTKTHEQKRVQNLISRTWAETHDRSRTSAELTRAGQEQNPHERDMGRTWPQFIRAGHEENANEQDMKGIIRISYDKSTYIYNIYETKTWDVITDLTNLIDGEFQYLSKGQKYPSQCRNYLVVLFSNVLIVTMRTFF